MITLYTWTTPNGQKPAILLAELGLSYVLSKVDLEKKEQKEPSYLAINPNGKIPALVDENIVVFESGAILLYLADREKRFIPPDPNGRAEVLSWLFWQVGGPGPFFGQLHHFADETPREEKAYTHFFEEAKRLASVLDRHLGGRRFIYGDYSIADIANYTWFRGAAELMPDVLNGQQNVREWLARIEARPAVKRGMELKPPKNGDDPDSRRASLAH